MHNVILLKGQTAIIQGCSAGYTTSLRHAAKLCYNPNEMVTAPHPRPSAMLGCR